jgi:hypothetical protein
MKEALREPPAELLRAATLKSAGGSAMPRHKKIRTLDGGDVGLDLVDLRKPGGEAELGNRWIKHWRQASETRKHGYVWGSLLVSLPLTGGLSLLIVPIIWSF